MLILCGLPRCGKTTVGQQLASLLSCPFIDTDHLIETAYLAQTGNPLSCKEIFLQHKEPFFRKLEEEQILLLRPPSFSLIALGGGVLESDRSLEHLKALGFILYLQIPLHVWVERVRLNPPAFLDPTSSTMMDFALRRMALYKASSHYTVDLIR